MASRFRHLIQALWAFLSNGHLIGFARGKIYQGPLKNLCLPGLNCYSCPGALGTCPIGSLQAVMGSRKFSVSFYVTGFLILFGALLGRLICGFLCPFGLVQDLLHKVPFFKKNLPTRADKALRYLKHLMLLVFVILLPLFVVDIIGQGDPAFCKYICPSGTLLAGWPLVLGNAPLWDTIGWLFAWKNTILIVVVILSLLIYRPFCKYLCPLGAIYGFFNRISLYRLSVDAHQCTKCRACARACKMGIVPYETPNHRECIRCGDCACVCPHGAIAKGFVKPYRQTVPQQMSCHSCATCPGKTENCRDFEKPE